MRRRATATLTGCSRAARRPSPRLSKPPSPPPAAKPRSPSWRRRVRRSHHAARAVCRLLHHRAHRLIAHLTASLPHRALRAAQSTTWSTCCATWSSSSRAKPTARSSPSSTSACRHAAPATCQHGRLAAHSLCRATPPADACPPPPQLESSASLCSVYAHLPSLSLIERLCGGGARLKALAQEGEVRAAPNPSSEPLNHLLRMPFWTLQPST